MWQSMRILAALAMLASCLCILPAGVMSTATDCKFTVGTKTYDLSSLKAANGSYVFSQPIDDTQGGYLYLAHEEGVTSTYTFQLQICGDVEKPASKACNASSPAYMISEDGSTCNALANIEAAVFSVNPYKDGINLRMYHGDALNHIQNYAATIYFVCDKTRKMSTPVFEHMTPFYAAHFKVFTSLVC